MEFVTHEQRANRYQQFDNLVSLLGKQRVLDSITQYISYNELGRLIKIVCEMNNVDKKEIL